MFGASPFGSTPFGAVGAGPSASLLTSGINLSGQVFGIAATPLSDALQLTGATAAQVINVLLDRLALTGTVLSQADFKNTLTDEIRYRDAMALGWYMTLQEGVTFDSVAAGQRTVPTVLADILRATGAVNVTFDAYTILTSVLALRSMLSSGWKEDLADTVEFHAALQEKVSAMATLLDSINVTDATTPTLRLLALAADEVQFSETLLPTSDVFERLADEVLFYGVIRLGDTEYTGWTLNKGASTEYRNYPFNGLKAHNGRFYGTSSSGLYELTGPTDAGDPIDWSLKTGVMDFLTGKLKRVPECYIAFAGGDTVMLKVITEEDGVRRADLYTATVVAGSALHNDRIKIGRGLSARYWQFELSGTGEFELDEIAWRPLVLDRRLY